VQSQLRRSQSEGPPQQHHIIVSEPSTTTTTSNTTRNHRQETGLMAAWVGRRRQIQDQQRPEHWFVEAKPIVATAAVRISIV